MKINPGLVIAGLSHRAAGILEKNEQLQSILKQVKKKLQNDNKAFVLLEDTGTIANLALDYAKRKYRAVSRKTIITIIAALLYFLNPFDLIPDFLVAGYLDDAVIIGYVVKIIQDEIRSYRLWKEGNQ